MQQPTPPDIQQHQFDRAFPPSLANPYIGRVVEITKSADDSAESIYNVTINVFPERASVAAHMAHLAANGDYSGGGIPLTPVNDAAEFPLIPQVVQSSFVK